MTKFMNRSFTVSAPMTKAYGDNYDRIFGKKPKAEPAEPVEEIASSDSESARRFAAGCHEVNPERVIMIDGVPHPIVEQVPIARVELMKWIERLTLVGDASRVEPHHVAVVRESMKMVLAAYDGEKQCPPKK